jgi:hypothetical protein
MIVEGICHMRWVKSLENFLSQWSSFAIRQEAKNAMFPKKAVDKKKSNSPPESKTLNIIMGTLWCMALIACPFFLIIFIDFKNWKLHPISLFSGWKPRQPSSLDKMIERNRRENQNPMRAGTIAYYTYGPGARRRI